MSTACATEPTTYEVPLGDGLSLLFPLLLDGVEEAVAGWQPFFVVTTDLDDPTVTPLCTLSLDDGISVEDAESWAVEALASHFAEAALGHYHYAFRAIDPDGQTRTLERGYIKFTSAGPAPA